MPPKRSRSSQSKVRTRLVSTTTSAAPCLLTEVSSATSTEPDAKLGIDSRRGPVSGPVPKTWPQPEPWPEPAPAPVWEPELEPEPVPEPGPELEPELETTLEPATAPKPIQTGFHATRCPKTRRPPPSDSVNEAARRLQQCDIAPNGSTLSRTSDVSVGPEMPPAESAHESFQCINGSDAAGPGSVVPDTLLAGSVGRGGRSSHRSVAQTLRAGPGSTRTIIIPTPPSTPLRQSSVSAPTSPDGGEDSEKLPCQSVRSLGSPVGLCQDSSREQPVLVSVKTLLPSAAAVDELRRELPSPRESMPKSIHYTQRRQGAAYARITRSARGSHELAHAIRMMKLVKARPSSGIAARYVRARRGGKDKVVEN